MRHERHLRWGIVGGGMLGLALAQRLTARGDAVTIFEASDRAGGLADAWRLGDVVWDRHYHVIVPADRALLALIDDLDLADQITWSKTGADLFDGARFHPLNGGLDFLRLPMLSLTDKARLAATILYAARIRDGRVLEDTPLEAWLTNLSGPRVFDVIWRPLLRSKLGDTYQVSSAQFIQAIARRLYSARAKGVAKDRFGTVKGGYDTIITRIIRHLSARGGEIVLNAPVDRIEAQGGGQTIVWNGQRSQFDRVIVTAPPTLAARLCRQLSEPEKARLNGVRYQGVICASALIDRPLRGAYMTYITDPKASLTSVIDMSAVVGRAAFGGRTLAYLPLYLASDDPLFEASDAALESRLLTGLAKLHPHIARRDIAAFRISRARHVLPVPVRGYVRAMPAITTSVPGLYTVNSANIVNGTLNVNETIDLADRALDEIAQDDRLAQRPAPHREVA